MCNLQKTIGIVGISIEQVDRFTESCNPESYKPDQIMIQTQETVLQHSGASISAFGISSLVHGKAASIVQQLQYTFGTGHLHTCRTRT